MHIFCFLGMQIEQKIKDLNKVSVTHERGTYRFVMCDVTENVPLFALYIEK